MEILNNLKAATETAFLKRRTIDARKKEQSKSNKINKQPGIQTLDNWNKAMIELQTDYQSELAKAEATFQKKMADYFTMNLTNEEINQLEFLNSVRLSEAEMQLQIEKFSGNVMALRKLEKVSQAKGLKQATTQLAKIKDLEYYQGIFNQCKKEALSLSNEIFSSNYTFEDGQVSFLNMKAELEKLSIRLGEAEEELLHLEKPNKGDK